MSAKAYNVTGSTGRGELYANAPTLRSTLRNSGWRKSAMGSGAEPRPMEFISGSTSGLTVCGYQFSDREPCELAALFTRAIAELKEVSP